MSTKRKLYTSIFSLVLIVIVTVAGTSLTLSALNVTLRTGFNVTYTAYNITADIYGAYKGGSVTSFEDGKITVGEGSADKIIFTGTESGTSSQTFDPFHITLTADNSIALIRYRIVNNNADKRNFPIHLDAVFDAGTDDAGTDNPAENLENFEIGYAVVNSSSDPADPADAAYIGSLTDVTAGSVDTYIYIRFKVKNLDHDATCNCNLTFTLGPA